MHFARGTTSIVAGSSESLENILDAFRSDGWSIENNADVFVRSYRAFGIDEAREVQLKAAARAFSARGRLFVLSAPVFTNEAQNALLKTLEDCGATFVLVVPSPALLLPTVRSRAQIARIKGAGATDTRAKKFLAAEPGARLEIIEALLEKGEDDRRDLANIITFLSSLERTLSLAPAKNIEALAAVYRARRYIGDNGALVKPLLESVALLA